MNFWFCSRDDGGNEGTCTWQRIMITPTSSFNCIVTPAQRQAWVGGRSLTWSGFPSRLPSSILEQSRFLHIKVCAKNLKASNLSLTQKYWWSKMTMLSGYMFFLLRNGRRTSLWKVALSLQTNKSLSSQAKLLFSRVSPEFLRNQQVCQASTWNAIKLLLLHWRASHGDVFRPPP